MEHVCADFFLYISHLGNFLFYCNDKFVQLYTNKNGTSFNFLKRGKEVCLVQDSE
jgi:hypothetical protein